MIGVILLGRQFGHDRSRAGGARRRIARGPAISAPSATCSAHSELQRVPPAAIEVDCSPATTGRRRPWPATTVC